MLNEANWKIRFATSKDLPSIVKIYNQAIKTNTATGDTQEFKAEDREDWFRKFNKDTFPIYVVETENKVVGYCALSPYRSGRKAMHTVAEISYYIDYSFHGKGIGTAVLKHAIEDCKRIGIESLLAILLDVNTQSVEILKKFKFVKWGHFPDIINLEGKSCGQLIYGLKLNTET